MKSGGCSVSSTGCRQGADRVDRVSTGSRQGVDRVSTGWGAWGGMAFAEPITKVAAEHAEVFFTKNICQDAPITVVISNLAPC